MRRKEKENIQMHGRVLQERKTVPIVWSALKKKKKKKLLAHTEGPVIY
jgi:hypothetical protein